MDQRSSPLVLEKHIYAPKRLGKAQIGLHLDIQRRHSIYPSPPTGFPMLSRTLPTRPLRLRPRSLAALGASLAPSELGLTHVLFVPVGASGGGFRTPGTAGVVVPENNLEDEDTSRRGIRRLPNCVSRAVEAEHELISHATQPYSILSRTYSVRECPEAEEKPMWTDYTRYQ